MKFDGRTFARALPWLVSVAILVASFVLFRLVGSAEPKTVFTGGVPNLDRVDDGLYRSGQPVTPEAWAYLRSLGIKTVVKLNYDEEGSDEGAVQAGMTVVSLPIPPRNDVASIVDLPERKRVSEVVRILERRDGVLVHCTHGQDRTGLVVGIYRVHHQHWTKSDAWHEMIQHHFHWELPGLDDFWEDFDGSIE
jgi:hypothetical protein